MLEYLSIGQIINTHGLRGAVKVYPLTDDISRFEKLKEVYVEENDGLVKYKVESVKFLSSTVSVKLKGVDSEEAANKLRGSYIKVDRKSAVKLPKDTYFICDLIDLEVYDEKGLLLGTVKDVLQTGSNDVYVIQSSGKDILIPALKDIVKKIDLENKKILVEMPEGLI
ncbi:MAG TPA: ribosome maturation factor RimM [Bacillota bacterium]|nr:ribosome maturation factor RimM [Bacillota bacterium]HPW41406.1 ribosome maturation factor RimM [Bacillota bacterium]